MERWGWHRIAPGDTGLSSHPLSFQGLELESKPSEGTDMVSLHSQSSDSDTRGRYSANDLTTLASK